MIPKQSGGWTFCMGNRLPGLIDWDIVVFGVFIKVEQSIHNGRIDFGIMKSPNNNL